MSIKQNFKQGIKQSVKQSILHAAEFSGVNRFFRWKTRKKLLGLCYHGVLSDDTPWDDPRTNIAVSATHFERQMQELRRHWRPISLTELDECLRTGQNLPDYAVFVSFDDGFENNLSVAAPILKKYGIPATVFVTTGLIGTENTIWPLELMERIIQWRHPEFVPDFFLPDDEKMRQEIAAMFVHHIKSMPFLEQQQIMKTSRQHGDFQINEPWQRQLYKMLDWGGVRELQKQGVEIGAHTVTHGNLARQTAEEVFEELRRSKQEIEQNLGTDCFSVAYPFGDQCAFNDSVVETVRNLGFRIGVTLCHGRNAVLPDPLRLNRLCVTGDLSLASFRALIAGWRR